MNASRVRGNFYVTALRSRNGKTYADQVGRQIRTRQEAFAILDRLNERGEVTEWSEHWLERYLVAERDAAGVWTSKDPFTGERKVLAVTA